MNLFLFLLRGSRLLVALAIIVGIISGAGSTGLIALINLNLRQQTLHQHESSHIPIISFVALCLIVLMTRIFSQIILIQLSQRGIYNLRLQLCRRILAAPLRSLEARGAHQLLAALCEDAVIITNALPVLPLLCVNIAIVVCTLIYLATLSLKMLLVVLVFLAIGLLSYRWPVSYALGAFQAARELQTRLFKHFRALTEGIKELKLHAARREAFLNEELQATAAGLRDDNIRGMNFYTIAASWGQMLFFIFIGLLIFLLPRYQLLDAALLPAYTLTTLYLIAPLDLIIGVMPMLGRAGVALQKIESLGLELAPESVATAIMRERWSGVELRAVTHSYYHEQSERAFTLGPINLKFSPAELVFIVGGNGSGKTTLAKLISGLYLPEQGEIICNGQPVTDENREAYRQHFAAIFTDFYLFESLLGLKSDQTAVDTRLDTHARELLVKLELDHKVKIREGTLSTIELSQGQRKRLALLTAYLEDRDCYIFDEWAADQDPLFKEIFYLNLLPELKRRGKTVLVITHDDRYFSHADRIVKIDYGQLLSSTSQETSEKIQN